MYAFRELFIKLIYIFTIWSPLNPNLHVSFIQIFTLSSFVSSLCFKPEVTLDDVGLLPA